MTIIAGMLAFLARFPWAIYMVRLVVLVIVFTAHEFAHALTATTLGDPTPREEGRLTLNPLRHLESIGVLLGLFLGIGWSRPVHFQPQRMQIGGRAIPDALGGVITVAAGPSANFALAMIGVGIMNINGMLPATPINTWPTLAEWLTVFVRLNLAIALFNLLPLFPLDGYMLIHEVLPLRAMAWWEAASGLTTLILGIGIAALLIMPTPWLLALMIPVVGGVNRAVLGW
jgi:Zn-dependent protease